MTKLATRANPVTANPDSKRLSITTYLASDIPCPHRVRAISNTLVYHALHSTDEDVRRSREDVARIVWKWAWYLQTEPEQHARWDDYYATWTPLVPGTGRHAFGNYIVLTADHPINDLGMPRYREFVVFLPEVFRQIESEDRDPFESREAILYAVFCEHCLNHWEPAFVRVNPKCTDIDILDYFYDWFAEFMPEPDDARELLAADLLWCYPMPSSFLTAAGLGFWQGRAPELCKHYVWLRNIELFTSIPTLDLMRRAAYWRWLDTEKPGGENLLH